MPSFSTAARLKRAMALGVASTVLATIALSASGLPASADVTVASDGFDRTVASGWGSTDAGGAWSLSGGTGSSVGSSAGTVSGVGENRSFSGWLSRVDAADVTVRSTFVVPSGTGVYYSAVARRQASGAWYGARARVDGNRRLHIEVVRTVNGTATIFAQKALTSVAAGQAVNVALLVSGTSAVTLRAKSYPVGTTEPAWQVSASDTSAGRIATFGKVGVSGYVSPGNAAQTFRTQAFSAVTAGAAAPAPTPAPPPPVAGAASGYGALPIGRAAYPVPSNAVFVSPSGDDGASGTQSAPVRTVTKALTKVSAGQTIVLRGGTYHEYFIVPPGKAVTIQNYPNEAVWFDGASPVSGFSAAGNAWRVGWDHPFDSSPTYTKGAPDGTAAGWTFLNPAYPMAAHPDGVWIDGAEQTQVGSLSQVGPGKFYVDRGNKQLYVGSNPAGRSVQASTLSQAVSLRAPGTTIRGMGFRRYANSVHQQGVITTYYKNQRLENVEVRDSATGGIGIYETGSTLKNVTITGSGQMGLQASYADGLVVDNVSIRNSNDQNFNPTPAAGGFKVTTTRGLTLKNSEITGTNGNQFWTDHSTYDITAVNNTITGGTRFGIVLEISSLATVANNVVANHARDGIYVVNTDRVDIWNNTLVGNGNAGLGITQDQRRIEQLSVAGHDRRRAQPDLSMPWVSRGVTVGNNIITGGSASKSTVYQAESWERLVTGNQMVSYSNGNVFSRPSDASPKNVAVWGRAGAYAVAYPTLAEFTRATGRDAASYALVASTPVDGAYRPVSAVSSRHTTVGQPLPSGVAAKIGRGAGTRHLGAFR